MVRVPDRLPAVALELVGLFNLEDVTLEEARVIHEDETETLEQRRLDLERAIVLREDIRNLAEELAETQRDILREMECQRFIASMILRSEPPPELLAEVQAVNERLRQLMEGNRQHIERSRQHMVLIEQRVEEFELQLEQSERRVARHEQIIANLAEE